MYPKHQDFVLDVSRYVHTVATRLDEGLDAADLSLEEVKKYQPFFYDSNQEQQEFLRLSEDSLRILFELCRLDAESSTAPLGLGYSHVGLQNYLHLTIGDDTLAELEPYTLREETEETFILRANPYARRIYAELSSRFPL